MHKETCSESVHSIINSGSIKELIYQDGDHLKWLDSQGVGPYGNTFHSPLAQLWFIYQAGGLNLDKIMSLTAEIKRSHKLFDFDDLMNLPISETGLNTPAEPGSAGEYLKSYLGVRGACEVQVLGDPSDVLDLILSHGLVRENNLGIYLTEKIKKSKRIMLAGCIGLPSAAGFIKRLQDHGFGGVLDIYDISEVPLRLIEAYYKNGFWQNIQINTFRRNLADESQPGKSVNPEYDMIMVDVLGHYLSDEEYSKIALFSERLKNKGLILFRDMGERVILNPEDRILGVDDDLTDKDFHDWLKYTVNFEVSLQDIEFMRKTLFSIDPPHGHRYWSILKTIDKLFSPGKNFSIKRLVKLLTVCSGAERLFPVYVFQKRPHQDFCMLNDDVWSIEWSDITDYWNTLRLCLPKVGMQRLDYDNLPIG